MYCIRDLRDGGDAPASHTCRGANVELPEDLEDDGLCCARRLVSYRSKSTNSAELGGGCSNSDFTRRTGIYSHRHLCRTRGLPLIGSCQESRRRSRRIVRTISLLKLWPDWPPYGDARARDELSGGGMNSDTRVKVIEIFRRPPSDEHV